MKNLLIWLLPLSVAWAGCEKDFSTSDRTDPNQNKFGRVEDGVKKPMKADLYSYAMPNSERIECIPQTYGDVDFPKNNKVGGFGTHLGELQMEKSTLIFDACYFGPGQGQVTTPCRGTLTADNGDELYYVGTCTYSAPGFTFTGSATFIGGTGRFIDCSGELEFIGKVEKETGYAEWTNEGYIILKK